MQTCETRNLVNATEQDVVDAMAEGTLEHAEIINILGEEYARQGNFDSDMWMIDLQKDLSPRGREFIYALANWCIWEQVGEKRSENYTLERYPHPHKY